MTYKVWNINKEQCKLLNTMKTTDVLAMIVCCLHDIRHQTGMIPSHFVEKKHITLVNHIIYRHLKNLYWAGIRKGGYVGKFNYETIMHLYHLVYNAPGNRTWMYEIIEWDGI